MIKVVGSLEDTITALAKYLHVSSLLLNAYAKDDTESGWDFGAGAWPCGSLHTAEGQTLHALVSVLNAKEVVECGSLYGCSSTHIASALYPQKGHLASVDVLEGTGSMFPDNLKMFRKQVYMKGEEYLAQLADNSVDMVYEDTDHTFEVTRDIWLAAIPKVRSGGVIVSHDSEHATAGETVTNAILEALGHDDVLTLLVPPADCGLLVWRKP